MAARQEAGLLLLAPDCNDALMLASPSSWSCSSPSSPAAVGHVLDMLLLLPPQYCLYTWIKACLRGLCCHNGCRSISSYVCERLILKGRKPGFLMPVTPPQGPTVDNDTELGSW